MSSVGALEKLIELARESGRLEALLGEAKERISNLEARVAALEAAGGSKWVEVALPPAEPPKVWYGDRSVPGTGVPLPDSTFTVCGIAGIPSSGSDSTPSPTGGSDSTPSMSGGSDSTRF